jgi:hypothetical protein
MTVDPAYYDLPKKGPYAPALGSALIHVAEPNAGHERAYNRWYEDEHFYNGAMFLPWMFAGRRWVATRDLQQLRHPVDSPIAQPVTAGCYASIYWVTAGRYDDHIRWSVSMNERDRAEGHGFYEWTHVYTAFHDFLGSRSREAGGPRDYQSLDYPYDGMVLEVVDASEDETRDALDTWLAETYVPSLQQAPRSPVAQTLRFAPLPLPADKAPDVADIPGNDQRVTMIHFLDEDPRLRWTTHFASHSHRIGDGGLGVLQLCAPFIPTRPGTDAYVDELR